MPFTLPIHKGELPNIRNSIFWNIGFPIVVILASILIFTTQINNLTNISGAVIHTERIIAGLNRTQRLLIDMETGLRGYIITRNQIFLTPYANGVRDLNPTMARMHELLAESPEQLERFSELQRLVDTWIDYAQIKKKESKLVYDFRQVRIIKGKDLMDRMRLIFDDMLAYEQRTLTDRREKVERSARITVSITVIWMIIVGFIFSIVSYRRILKQTEVYNKIISELDMARTYLQKSKENLEKAVEDRTVELRASNAELEAFCYSVSHDLRAPLRGIDGFAQVLFEDYAPKLDTDGIRSINYIREGVQKMGHLIDDLLLLSRITRADLTKSKLDLSNIAKTVAKKVSSDQKADRRIFQIQENLIAEGDEGLLEIILQNLFSNAHKFSRASSNPQIQFGQKIEDDEKIYFVKDNGTGFDMKYKDKLFRPFQRLHPKVEGTGIGLATVKRIIDKHGGRIWIESEPGIGTTVFFTLPEGGMA